MLFYPTYCWFELLNILNVIIQVSDCSGVHQGPLLCVSSPWTWPWLWWGRGWSCPPHPSNSLCISTPCLKGTGDVTSSFYIKVYLTSQSHCSMYGVQYSLHCILYYKNLLRVILFRGEVGREEEILKQWMDVGITEAGLIKLFLQFDLTVQDIYYAVKVWLRNRHLFK